MAETTTITIELSAELSAKLDRLAELSGRSQAALAAEALDEFTSYELDMHEKILEGIADVDAGRFFTQEQVEQETARIVNEARAREANEVRKAARA